MNYSSSLIDITNALILDTSVLINLHACKYGERILQAVPNEIVVPKIVAGELEHNTSVRNGENRFLHDLLKEGIVALATLTDSESAVFEELTSASPSLGDGEAATITIASARHLVPIIDERRGRSRFRNLAQTRTLGWSLDLFFHPKAVASLGGDLAVEAVYLALRDGRMRIPPESADSVVALIGKERSHECTCLPGYRERFRDAPNSHTEKRLADLENQNFSD